MATPTPEQYKAITRYLIKGSGNYYPECNQCREDWEITDKRITICHEVDVHITESLHGAVMDCFKACKNVDFYSYDERGRTEEVTGHMCEVSFDNPFTGGEQQ